MTTGQGRTGTLLPGAEGAVVETSGGPVFVRTIGVGAPVLVLHGGPGFDHRYLIAPLAPLARRRRLIFYDQAGCGLTPAASAGVNPEATFAQARTLLRLVGEVGCGRIGVVAHSWGALVLAAAYAGPDTIGLPQLAEGVLVNPVALARRDWDIGVARLLSRASPEIIARFSERLAAGDGEGAMAAALPIYTRRGYASPVPAFPLNAATYLAISASLGDFDVSAGAAALAHLTLISGTDDFTPPETIAALMARVAAVLRPEVGHFPFFEAPDAFAAQIDELFR